MELEHEGEESEWAQSTVCEHLLRWPVAENETARSAEECHVWTCRWNHDGATIPSDVKAHSPQKEAGCFWRENCRTGKDLRKMLQVPARLSASCTKAGMMCLFVFTQVGLPSSQHMDALATFLTDCRCTYGVGTLIAAHWETQLERQMAEYTAGCCTLLLNDELLIMLMKLRVNCPNQDLALRFTISSSSVSRIFMTWHKCSCIRSWKIQQPFVATQGVDFHHDTAVIHRPFPVNPNLWTAQSFLFLLTKPEAQRAK